MNLNPFASDSEPSPHDRIAEIETTLKSAVSRRKDVRRDLKSKKRDAVRDRNRAESQLDNASGSRAEELQAFIEGREAMIQEYQDRIKALTSQITAIQKRFPRLEILKTDIELLADLHEDDSWQEHVDALIDEIRTEDPVSGTADSELNALLDEIDQMLDQDTSTAQVAPVDVDNFGVTDDHEEDDHEEDDREVNTGH
jgi:chromosome segregation ATPase